jgi:hypothetical protein
MTIGLLDNCQFTAGSSGTADFTDGTALDGKRNLDDAGAVNGKVYSYRAVHPSDPTIWEDGSGAYNSGTGKIARTTIDDSSTGSKVNFAVAPIVTIGPSAADLFAIGTSYAFGATDTISNAASASYSVDSSKAENVFLLQELIPATDSDTLQILASIDNGSNFNVSIAGGFIRTNGSSVNGVTGASTTTGLNLINTVGSAAGERGVSGELRVRQVPGLHTLVSLVACYVDDGGRPSVLVAQAKILTTSPVTNIRLKYAGGDIESGSIVPITRRAA